MRVLSCKRQGICVTLGLLPLLALEALQAQVTVSQRIDIGTGLRDSLILATVVPANDPTRAFDGNPFTEMLVQNSDTLVITLQFLTPPRVLKSSVFFWNTGKWLLEAADSLDHLNQRRGSYVLLHDSANFAAFTWDSVEFSQRQIRFIRLRARNLVENSIALGEWELHQTRTFISYVIFPYPPRVLPGTSLQLSTKMLDSDSIFEPVPYNAPLEWTTSDPAIATVTVSGRLTGVALGMTEVQVSNEVHTLTGRAPVTVGSDFRATKVAPMTAKVALVLPDPILPGGQRLHQHYGWRDPVALTHRLITHFRESSDSVVNFQIVDTIWTDSMYTRYNDTLLNVTRYMYLYDHGLLQQPPYAQFDYIELVLHYDFDLRRNNGEIDEVWVYSPPWTGMYESQLMGPRAFWWNSPPITTGTRLTKLLSVMGLNYERGVDLAFHSFGHRFESAMVHAYGDNWNPRSTNPTPWDLFTRIDRETPGLAHVGNIHFPPNGRSDYDYGNATYVNSYAENWYRYPYLFDQHRQVNVLTWRYPEPEPLAESRDHLGYLRWWYDHAPRYIGVTDSVLNNWWHYALDFEAAVELARRTPLVGVREDFYSSIPSAFALYQNYPNPFNPSTTIPFQVWRQGIVTLKIFDLLGREVSTLVNDVLPPGSYEKVWDAGHFASGVYFYRLRTAEGGISVRKMVLIR
ncbi:MAG: T9SS type A sorting domain-containing protein [Ignavibacteriae bacterium]|nr:T9SS type A sorting domain-containing protein [Ignavibacteriota bacterium]